MRVKHATADAFLFHRDDSDMWRVGLIMHPRTGLWSPPGGHVEFVESPAETVVREVVEETGLGSVRWMTPPGPSVPDDFPPTVAPMMPPWWIMEQSVSADGRTSVPHVHIDHQYVGVVGSIVPVSEGEMPVEWFTAEQVASSQGGMPDDTRALVLWLFGQRRLAWRPGGEVRLTPR